MAQPVQTTSAMPETSGSKPFSVQPPTLQAEQLSFGYRLDDPVISQTDAVLSPGRLTVLIGPNATGKTTLLRLMLGQLSPQRGRVLLDGWDITGVPAAVRARRVGYVAQRSPVAFGFSVGQIVAMGRFAQRDGNEAAVERALRDCDLMSVVDRPYNELSGGQQQRVSVARALAQSGWGEPGRGRAILLDEPVASADLRHAHQTLELLKRAADADRAVLAVLHDLNLAARWADEVWLMDGGAIACAGSWEQVLTSVRLEPVYGAKLTPLIPPGGGRPVFHAVVPPLNAASG